MTKRVHGLWIRFTISMKHASHRSLMPEYHERQECYRQFIKYANTY